MKAFEVLHVPQKGRPFAGRTFLLVSQVCLNCWLDARSAVGYTPHLVDERIILPVLI